MTRPALTDPDRPLTIAVLGAGTVGRTLALGWLRAGHRVILGSRTPDSDRIAGTLSELRAAANGKAAALTAAEHAAAVSDSDIVVLTVPGDQVPALLDALGDTLAGRLVIDTTNNPDPATGALNSIERVRSAGGIAARAYNSVGWEQMAQPVFGDVRSDMLYTSPDDVRPTVERLLEDTGFRPIHLGDGPAAHAAVDAMARLWFLLAFDRGWGRRLGYRLLSSSDDRPASRDDRPAS